MVWSVDQDDENFSALSVLVGKSLPSFADEMERTTVTDTRNWTSQNSQNCIIIDCLDSPTWVCSSSKWWCFQRHLWSASK